MKSYFKLNNNFDDVGPNNDDGSASGSYSFSTDVPFSAQTNYNLDLEVQWTNLVYDLSNEELCIYGGTMDTENIKVEVWNVSSSSWDTLFNDLSSNSWNNISIVDWLTDETFTIRFKGFTEASDTNQDQWNIDTALIHTWSDESYGYELDLEVSWTSAVYNEPNEELCIYGGTMGSENLRVDVWHNSAWQNLFTNLSSGWNNATISSYLDSPNFTIRFKGSTESNDDIQDSWNIDATLLHVWSN